MRTRVHLLLALAFPLHPPGRPERSRADELRRGHEGGRPLLVVQGERDAFGTPDELRRAVPRGVQVVAVGGDHGLKQDVAAVAAAATRFLDSLI